MMIRKYFDLLKKNREVFEKAEEIAESVKKKAKEIFGDCEVYLIGSYVRGDFTLSSDLDILIISDKIPEKFDFDWYSNVVKKLTNDDRVNVHLVNRKKFAEVEKLYRPRLPVK